MKDLAKSSEVESLMKKIIKKLQRSGLTDPFHAAEILEFMEIPSFDDLTSIDRTWMENSKTQDFDLHENDDAAKVWKLLRESRTDFLNVIVRNTNELDLKEVSLHPMDILYNVFRKTSNEATRILTENLDKMKIAFPIVLPSYNEKPQLQIWPLQSITRQTIKSKFKLFENNHHAVACVRLSDSNGLDQKFSIHSKSDILNQTFFPGQHRFICRNHPGLINKIGIKHMKRIYEGAIESAIFTPNEPTKNNELDQFFEIWNLSGSINKSGLKPQINFIKSFASVLIVFIDNDRNIEGKKKQINDIFGANSTVLVVILDHYNEDNLSSSDTDDDESNILLDSTNIKFIHYKTDRKEESFQAIRHFVANCLTCKPNFSYSKLIKQMSNNENNFLGEFEIDMENTIIKQSSAMVDDMGDKLKKIIDKHSDGKLQEIIFPIYFSKSPLDKTKKIVQHIENLNERKVKLFNIHQRAEFQQDNEIEEQIQNLRLKQVEIAGRSEFVHIYLKQMEDITSKSKNAIEKEEWIRIYHKLLTHKLTNFAVEGLDIVGFQRELGQLYISTIENNRKTSKLKQRIVNCFEQIISAGVSIELVDGDTQNVNKDIILHILQQIE